MANAFLVENSDLTKVSTFLKGHLPGSVTVLEVVNRIREGHDPGFRVWASTSKCTSCYNAIVVSVDPTRCKDTPAYYVLMTSIRCFHLRAYLIKPVFCKNTKPFPIDMYSIPGGPLESPGVYINPVDYLNPFYRQLVHVFCIDPGNIISILSSPGVVNFNENILFYGISETDMKYISSMETLRKYKMTQYFVGCQFWCFHEDDIKVCSVPDGISFSKITQDAVETMMQFSWTNCMMGSEVAHSDLIAWEFPSILAYTSKDGPIAWVKRSFWGDQGSLFVTESYRQKGIAKYIVSKLARSIIRQEGAVCVVIGVNEDVSETLHKKLGFTKIENPKYIIQGYTLT